MARLKGVIFGVQDVFFDSETRKFDAEKMEEVGRLIKFLHSQGIASVGITNHQWVVTNKATGSATPLQQDLEKSWGVPFRWFAYGQEGFPPKQTTAALQSIRDAMNWCPNETLYLGNSVDDMRSAVNGGTLFLNALWYRDTNPYGFRFTSPKDIARFVDVFCLREHFWYFKIEDDGLGVYCLAPYSTYKVAEYKEYSESLIETVKRKLGDKEDVQFWAKYLCTSMYFSGVYEPVDYIAPYPGHLKGAPVLHVLQEPLAAFAKCFRGKFLPDLIVRHTTAPEAKRDRDAASHLNQLNTIHLNEHPQKSNDERFVKSPLSSKKTICVLDDILTNGYSFEAARAFVARTGASVVCVAFLKSMKRDYMRLGTTRFGGSPFAPVKFPLPPSIKKTYGYHENIVDSHAATDLANRLDRYHDWDWRDE
jgi:hypothetical protein